MVQFSIIIPVFNAAETVDDCIMSVVSQTYQSFEILLVDDGSDDGSLEICEQWKKKDSRIRVFHQKNCGASSARNTGIRNAIGQYIQFVDADDTITSDCLEKIQTIIERYQEPDVVEYRLNYFGPNGVNNIQGTILKDGIYDREYLQNVFLPCMLQCEENREIYYNLFNVLRFVKRGLLINQDIFFDEQIKRWEDMLFAIQVFSHADKMAVTSDALYNYYGHIGGGLGGKYDPNTFYYVKKTYMKLTELCGERYDMYSEYAEQKKVEQIERCVREICDNEDRNRRRELIYDIFGDPFFIDCMYRNSMNQKIMCVRTDLLNGNVEKAYRKLMGYIRVSGIMAKIRGYLSGVYHRWIKGEI